MNLFHSHIRIEWDILDANLPCRLRHKIRYLEGSDGHVCEILDHITEYKVKLKPEMCSRCKLRNSEQPALEWPHRTKKVV
jgi:hypothetical protein